MRQELGMASESRGGQSTDSFSNVGTQTLQLLGFVSETRRNPSQTQLDRIILLPDVVGVGNVIGLLLLFALLPIMPGKYVDDTQGRRTHPLIWCAAVICAVFAIAVIITGIVVFVGYIIIHPRIPVVSVLSASLDTFRYDEVGVLVTQVTMDIVAENDNARAHARFQNMSFFLIFGGMEIAHLMAPEIDVGKNRSLPLHYIAESRPIPLDPERMELVNQFLRQKVVVFDLKGKFKAQWRVGLLGSVKFWCHLNCNLRFYSNGTYISKRPCSSRAK